jgi:hypothetical protein
LPANYGYDEAEIKIFLDDDEDPETQPTRENIVRREFDILCPSLANVT